MQKCYDNILINLNDHIAKYYFIFKYMDRHNSGFGNGNSSKDRRNHDDYESHSSNDTRQRNSSANQSQHNTGGDMNSTMDRQMKIRHLQQQMILWETRLSNCRAQLIQARKLCRVTQTSCSSQIKSTNLSKTQRDSLQSCMQSSNQSLCNLKSHTLRMETICLANIEELKRELEFITKSKQN